MNTTHLHLLLNHFPIIGTLIATVLLVFSFIRNNTAVQKVSLGTIFIMALIAIPVFLTGEPAEESVENLPGVLEPAIEAHEEAAELAFWVMMVAGAVSAAALLLLQFQHKTARVVVLVSLLLSAGTSALMARTGYLGGQIRHTEISGNSSLVQPASAVTGETEDED